MEKTRENPYPFAEGTGFARVQVYIPGPVPQGPLPVTLAGFETRGIPYIVHATYIIYKLILPISHIFECQ